jgi:hypothetical protein
MNINKLYKAILILSTLIIYTGCTDLFTNPSNPTSSSSKLSVTVSSPKSQDTIVYTGAAITYTLKTDTGINYIELYVNGVFYKQSAVNTDGTQPTITLVLDSTYVGKRVSFYLKYYDKDGSSARSDSITNILVSDISRVPYVPYGLTAMTITSSIINLSWKDSTASSSPGYEIWRKRGFYGQFAVYLTANPNTYNANDADASDTTVYYYKIRGLNSYGASNFSAVMNTYGDGASRSVAPPTNLKATSESANMVSLSWTNDISGVNYYKIERRYSWTTYVTVAYALKGATTFVDSANGLTGSSTYLYRVKAITGRDSSWSNEVTITTPWE